MDKEVFKIGPNYWLGKIPRWLEYFIIILIFNLSFLILVKSQVLNVFTNTKNLQIASNEYEFYIILSFLFTLYLLSRTTTFVNMITINKTDGTILIEYSHFIFFKKNILLKNEEVQYYKSYKRVMSKTVYRFDIYKSNNSSLKKVVRIVSKQNGWTVEKIKELEKAFRQMNILEPDYKKITIW
jgi:hypothetical protein